MKAAADPPIRLSQPPSECAHGVPMRERCERCAASPNGGPDVLARQTHCPHGVQWNEWCTACMAARPRPPRESGDEPNSYADGFADGVEFVMRHISRKLDEALQEPRRQPSDRRGRITALGNLLAELAEGTP